VAWAYLGGSAGILVVAVILLRVGLGDPESPLALHGVKLLALDSLVLAAAAYGVVHALGILRALDALPWRAGRYLFPGIVVDAVGPVLDVWSVGDAESVERVGGPESALALKMRDGTRVVVHADSAQQAERADAALGTVRGQLAQALAEEDPHVLAELDPLHDRAMSSPIGPTASMKPPVVVSKRFDWAIAIAAGIGLGLLLGTTRNAISDKQMYEAVVAAGTVSAYQQYLAQGGGHSDDVRDVLLPRAQLKDAQAQGTVEAVQAFADAHAGSKIGSEIDAALRQTMLVELDKAKKVGTVTALDELTKKYPNHTVDAEIKQARHALFAQALDAWKAKAHPDAPTAALFDKLLAWTESNGPGCELRFRMKPSKTIEDADKSIMRSGHYPAADALPSKYVTADAMKPREQRVEDAIVAAFSPAFPSDILALHAGASLDADAPLPADAPAVVVDYVIDWSRANTLQVKPLTVLAGFIFSFEGTFVVPGATPLKFSTRTWRGPEPWKLAHASQMLRETFEQKIYDTILDGGFDQIEKKLSDVLL